jgi:hypothetical protein
VKDGESLAYMLDCTLDRKVAAFSVISESAERRKKRENGNVSGF